MGNKDVTYNGKPVRDLSKKLLIKLVTGLFYENSKLLQELNRIKSGGIIIPSGKDVKQFTDIN